MTALIAPGKRYAHLDAEQAKDTLLKFVKMERKAFNILMNDDDACTGSEPYVFYLNFFINQGLIIRMDDGSFQLSEGGIALATGQIRDAISRENADLEIKEIAKRASWILDDPDQIYFIRGVFIFGSYVDSKKEILGDLDVALSYGIKKDYAKMSDSQLMLIAREIQRRSSVGGEIEEIDDPRIWSTDKMLEFIHSGNQFISLHMLKELPTLRIQQAMWVYDSLSQVSEGFLLDKRELPMINLYLDQTM